MVVKPIKCVVCSKYEDRIKNIEGFSKTWTDGTESVKKDSLEIHIKGDPCQKACDELIYGCIILSRENCFVNTDR